MTNNTGQNILLISEDDGEILFKVKQGESINVRSEKQTKNDKYYSPKVKVNQRSRFTKVMDREKEIIKMFMDTPSTYLAMSIMKFYIKPSYNVLMKNGAKYRAVDLAEEMNISRQMATLHIKKLKEKNILADIETSQGKMIAVNPYYYCKSEEVPQAVIDLFNK